MRKVVIVAVEAVTALGDLEATWEAITAGRTGIAEVTRFPTASYNSSYAALINELECGEDESYITPLLAHLSASFANNSIPEDARLFTASTKAGVDGLERAIRGGTKARPTTLFKGLLDQVRSTFGIKDRGVNVSAACASSTIAIANATRSIGNGFPDTALVVGADIITEFVFSGFSSLRALSPLPCHPFDTGRDGLTLGEAGVAILLMSEERAAREGLTPLATISGWGASNDATHVTAPARDGCGLIEASTNALKMAGLAPGEIGALCAHGTATVFNDAMELTAFAKIFNNVFGPTPPPLVGFKGATGHTMGAAGALEVALCVKALATGTLPPTVGLNDPDERAKGWATTASTPFDGPILTSNSGFGGVNGVLILEGPR